MVKKKRPLLFTDHKKKRIKWLDKIKINRIGSDRQVYVWKKKGEELTVKGTIKFEEGSLMVWGCIGWNGVGVLSEVEGKMDDEQYPTQSPDLNSIEHTWNHLKKSLSDYKSASTGVYQLWERVIVE
ncbi:hypothetical protein J3A83DRAFT_4256871 [Scleroderma citrinum]